MALSLFACVTGGNTTTSSTTNNGGNPDDVTVMSWAEYMAAEIGSKVVIEAYVQGHQSWWNNKLTVYAQDEVGGYFLYDFPCTEEMANQLTPGTKIRVYGYKAAWAGEIEIVSDELDPDYARIEIIEGNYVADPINATELLGKDELVNYQNMLVKFENLEVVSISFKNDGGDDIYVNLKKGDAEYSFCVEVYLTGTSTDVYKAVSALKVGDVIDVVGFAYWYNGINTHITSITVK